MLENTTENKKTEKIEDINFICCFTGHRKLPPAHIDAIKAELDRVVDILIRGRTTIFRTGGAMGFDTLAALTILDRKMENPELRLELCLPCRNQTEKWDEESKAVYEYIRQNADEVHYVSEEYTSSCMLARNRFMVDGSTYCVAYCENPDARRGGTAYTVRYAKKTKTKLINIAQQIGTLQGIL